MKTHGDGGNSFPNTLLTASILFAQIDMHGLLDYGLKALLGGGIWLAYKVASDRIDSYRKAKEAK